MMSNCLPLSINLNTVLTTSYLQSNLQSALCDLEAINTLFPNPSIVSIVILLFVEFCTAKLARNQSRMCMLISLILPVLRFIDFSYFIRCVLCTIVCTFHWNVLFMSTATCIINYLSVTDCVCQRILKVYLLTYLMNVVNNMADA